MTIVATQSSMDWTTRMQHRLWKTKVRIAGGIQRQKELRWKRNRSLLVNTTDDDCNGCDLITVFNYVMDAGCIDSIACIDSDADYPESSNRGSDASGYYYGYYENWTKVLGRFEGSSHTRTRGIDDVFIPVWLQVRPNQFTIESGRETGGDQYLSREWCAFPARTTPDQSFKKVREMINNLITRLKEDTFSEDEHKVCVILNWQRTLVHSSRLRWRIWQWKWRNFSPRYLIKSTTIFSWKWRNWFKTWFGSYSGNFSERLVWYRDVTTQQIAQRQICKRKYSMITTSTMRRRRQTKSLSRMFRTLN